MVLQGLANIAGKSWLPSRVLAHETISGRANGSTAANAGRCLVPSQLLDPCAKNGRGLQKFVNQFIFILQLVLEHGALGPKLSILGDILVKLSLFEIELIFDILFLVEAIVLVATVL